MAKISKDIFDLIGNALQSVETGAKVNVTFQFREELDPQPAGYQKSATLLHKVHLVEKKATEPSPNWGTGELHRTFSEDLFGRLEPSQRSESTSTEVSSKTSRSSSNSAIERNVSSGKKKKEKESRNCSSQQTSQIINSPSTDDIASILSNSAVSKKKEKKRKPKREYVDLTGSQMDNDSEVECLREKLRQLLSDSKRCAARGKQNCLEGEVSVDPY